MYTQCIFGFFPYCHKWDAATFDAAIHAMQLQDEEYYLKFLKFIPFGWTPKDNTDTIEFFKECEQKGVPLYAANRDLWYQSVGIFVPTYNDFEDIKTYDITQEMRRFLLEHKMQQENLISCSTLSPSWKEI